MSSASHRKSFIELVQNETAISLDRAALLIAAEEYEELPIDRYVAQLDTLAERVASRLHSDAGPYETIDRLRKVLAEEERFTGNAEEYYDPRNSFLNEVLERKTGIPIALSAVYMEVGRRIGFSLEGIGFPGHFLVKHVTSSEEIIVDPFHGGCVLGDEDLQSRLDSHFRGRVRLGPELLRSVTTRQLLFRMLSNLKAIYVHAQDSERALAAVERMLILAPDQSREQRDRGVLLARLDRPYEALSVLARYREEEPNAADATDVDTLMEQLRLKVGMSN